MTDAMLGANPDELKGLAKYVDSTSQDLNRTTNTLDAVLNGQIRWFGQDAARCRQQWAGSMRPALNQAISMLAEVSKVLVRNADEQIKASAVDGSSGHHSSPGGGKGKLPALPPDGTDPKSVNKWWDSLSPEEQRRYIAEHPEQIGNLDGIPATVRDAANRLRLDGEETALRDELTRLGPDDDARRAEIDKALGTIDQIRKSVEKLESSGEQAQVLVFDDSQHPPRAAVGVGNADTADNVGVFTPGIGSEPDTKLSGYVNDMLALKRRTDRLNMSTGSDDSTALIAWIGYDAPSGPGDGTIPDPHVVEAANPINGIEGGRVLAHFAEGLDASNPNSNLTAIGHSYGSYVTGEAAQNTDVFDNFVVFGSPGIGTSDADNLNVPDGHAYVLEAKGDAVADLGAFGDDPNQMSGLEDLSTSSSSHGSASSGHSQYLQTDSTSQYNIATVVAGRPDLAVHGQNSGFGDAVRGTIGLTTGVDVIRGGVEGVMDGGAQGGDIGDNIAGLPGRIVGTGVGGIIGGVDGAVDSVLDDGKGIVNGVVGGVKGLFD